MTEQFSPLPEEYRKLYDRTKGTIKRRLEEFAAVERDQWFYELAFCLLTPQSKALHANAVIEQLQDRRFREEPFDPTSILRAKEHYIRFHNVKAKRLLALQNQWQGIEAILDSEADVRDKRDTLAATVNGVGMKEASHFMRNVGFRGLAIIDRHVITGLEQCGVYSEVPSPTTPKRYRAIEDRLEYYANYVRINMDELDLVFWSYITGMVLK